jgi:hypothetical protein
MKKLSHQNLFQYYGKSGKQDSYNALQEHFNQDTVIHMLWDIVLIGCALGAVFIANHAEWLWIFGGIYAAERKLSRFVDNSNRNWTMHLIDYLETMEDES